MRVVVGFSRRWTMSDVKSGVGKAIVVRLEGLGWTQEHLARRIGTSQAQVSRVLCGRQGLRFHRLVKVCKALGVKPSQLLQEAGL
jgi:transcriptional regulator with XRE-family HTH domain